MTTNGGGSTRRSFLKSTGAVTGAALLAGCSGAGDNDDPETTDSGQTTESTDGGNAAEQTETEQSSQSPQKGGTLQLTIDKLDTLDPVKSYQANSYGVRNQMMDGLVMDLNGDLNIEGVLAEEYEVSDDGRTYTFHLKEGVKYHNGEEVTADDFVYVFERVAASPNSVWTYFIFSQLSVAHETDGDGNYVPGSLATEAPDDYTFKFTLENPYYATMGIISYMTFAAAPAGIVGDVEGYEGEMEQAEYANAPVGCGPFKFKNWESGTEIEVERFDDYHGQVPYLDGIHWQVMADSNAKYNLEMSKHADIIDIPTSKYDANKISVESTGPGGREIGTYGPLRNGLTANYEALTGMNPTYMMFNAKKVPKKIRQAFMHVLNQQEIAQTVFKGRSSPAAFMMPPFVYPGGAEAQKEAAEEYPYGYQSTNIEKARQLVAEAGYDADNPYQMQFDGWETDAAESMGQLMRDKLAAVNIELDVQISPASTYWSRASSGDFDLYLSGWGMTAEDPGGLLTVMVPDHTLLDSPSVIEYARWEGTDAAERANEAWETVESNPKPIETQKEKRSEAFITIEKANWEDAVFIPIIHNRVEQFSYQWAHVPKPQPVGEAFYRFNNAWLEDSEERP